MYADYGFYKEHGSGNIPEEKFPRIARRAQQQIDYVTFDRVSAHSLGELSWERIKMCLCELVDHLWDVSLTIEQDEDGISGVISNERVGPWSASYQLPQHLLSENLDESMHKICQRWLTRPINLMYVGVS
ncbi:MAG: hypothetical protein FWE08_03815 [Oscillospiraceae bacterium]|nr:hypothetical protein [Oscillospiraceae bacterium]